MMRSSLFHTLRLVAAVRPGVQAAGTFQRSPANATNFDSNFQFLFQFLSSRWQLSEEIEIDIPAVQRRSLESVAASRFNGHWPLY